MATYLRLVRNHAGHHDDGRPRFEQVQQPLLPATEHTLAICAGDALNEKSLLDLLGDLNPRLVLDFRTAPRFDFGSLNRGRVFQLFEARGTRYVDLGALREPGTNDIEAFAELVVERIEPWVHEVRNACALILANPGSDYERIGLASIRRIRERTGLTWELLLFGRSAPSAEQRSVLFLSHANPEDNAVALWLQAQLTRLGYEVWSDLTRLRPGEVFWDSIEDTIRNKAARVIVLVSRASMCKPGVLDEISLAVSTERVRGIAGFVMPVRVDDIPYADLRANIARKHVIDFHESWAAGLTSLVQALMRDRVPRARGEHRISLASWWNLQRRPCLSVAQEGETLLSNRFRVSSLPLRVHVFDGAPKGCPSADLVPLMSFRKKWLSFLSNAELAARGITGLTLQTVVSSKELFSGSLPITAHLSDQARKRLLHAMLNRLWVLFLVSRGLRLYTHVGSRRIPYIPNELIANNVVLFRGHDGKQRKRLLVGYSAKRKLYWHLAPEASFTSVPSIVLNLKLRVLFSLNGQDEWPTVARMRDARRTFCKNWWNDRWYSLQTALMAWLSRGSDEIEVYTGEAGKLLVRSSPVTFQSPVSIREFETAADQEQQWKELDESTEIDWWESDGDADGGVDSSEGL